MTGADLDAIEMNAKASITIHAGENHPDPKVRESAHAVLALVARARQADRLEEERDEARQNAERFRQSMYAVEQHRTEHCARADRAEAEATRLRVVVEKLRPGYAMWAISEALRYKGCCDHELGFDLLEKTYARLLAETAPDVTADEGRVGA